MTRKQSAHLCMILSMLAPAAAVFSGIPPLQAAMVAVVVFANVSYHITEWDKLSVSAPAEAEK